MNTPAQKPTLFEPGDSSITIVSEPEKTEEHQHSTLERASQIAPPTSSWVSTKLFSLGFLLISSVFALFCLWASAALISSLEALIARNDILGWTALSLVIIAVTSLCLLLLKELIGLWRLKNLGHLRARGQQIHDENKLKPALRYLKDIKYLYEHTNERQWMLGRLTSLETQIMDGREMVDLIDQEIGAPLDKDARAIIANHAKKVSLITAIAPGPIIDMAAIAFLNLRMIRKIASVYGVRPGFWGQMRLARNVIAHLALSGGIAMTSDLLQPLIGTSIAAKLSKKLGEGLFNGALTIRIGLSALALTRPIPHVKTKPPSFSKLATSSFKPI